MNTEELSLSVGVDLKANIIQPCLGDLLVLSVDATLTMQQRERVQSTLIPLLEGLGCKAVLLEKGFDLVLVKQAVETPAGE
jgi:hypothetical protein